MSDERCLKGDVAVGESDTIDTIKKKRKDIIDMAVAGDALQNLRQKSEYIQLFEISVSLCLIHLTTLYNWQYDASSVVISDIFTPSDKGLCILLLENNATDYV